MNIEKKFYEKIIKIIPISCVDLIVLNKDLKVLLVKRKNYPAKEEWWFPGGRVLYGEKRVETAIRKLKEECCLVPKEINELGTFDIFFKKRNKISYHGITTIFKVFVEKNEVILDDQSIEYSWRFSNEWKKEKINDFILKILKTYC